MDTTDIYRELDAARIEVELLAAMNSVSLNTPAKRLAWDVAYDRAKARLYRAQAARNDLVQRMSQPLTIPVRSGQTQET